MKTNEPDLEHDPIVLFSLLRRAMLDGDEGATFRNLRKLADAGFFITIKPGSDSAPRTVAASVGPADRYTSREAGARFGVLSFDAIPLLRAASVPCVRHGSGILWDAAAVERLVATLADRQASATTSPACAPPRP